MKLKTYFGALLSIMVLSINLSHAQTETTIAGKLIDQDTKEPIPFATIRLRNKSIGVISNSSGDFTIPRLSPSDTLEVSCIGFSTIVIPFGKLKTSELNISASGSLHSAKGKIYIEKETFAIHKLQYACYNKTMRETQLMFEIQTEYTRIGSYMYLNYISFNNVFKTRNDANFKLISMDYSKRLNALVLDFNMPPQRATAIDKKNYQFKIGNDELLIVKAYLETDRKVVLVLDDKYRLSFQNGFSEISSNLSFNIKNIHDLQNREVDQVTSNAINQFRELFVQRVSPGKEAFSSNFIQTNKPLSQNVPTPSTDDNQFWMNSPLKKSFK